MWKTKNSETRTKSVVTRKKIFSDVCQAAYLRGADI